MSRNLSLAIAAVLAVAASGCMQSDTDSSRTGAPGTLDAAATAQVEIKAAVTPGETLAWLIAIDQHEIASATQASKKEIDEDVRAYADAMHTEHRRNLSQTRAVADASGVDISDSPALKTHRAETGNELERLDAMDGEQYASAYLAAMVESHTNALVLIDEHLEQTADGAIQEHLQATRDIVARHRDRAEGLQTDG